MNYENRSEVTKVGRVQTELSLTTVRGGLLTLVNYCIGLVIGHIRGTALYADGWHPAGATRTMGLAEAVGCGA